MKWFKWFLEDASSEAHVAREYAEMPDRKLVSINPSDLTQVGLKCYREEVERRKARSPGLVASGTGKAAIEG